jgi:hypothetical protein
MSRRRSDGQPGDALALMAVCLAAMVAAVALGLAHERVPDASVAVARVAGAGLVASGFLDALRP